MNLSRLVYLVLGRDIPRRRRKHRKPDPSAAYRAWIRTLECLACHRRPVHAAHTGTDGGTGIKSSGWSCVPLCLYCHLGDYHAHGKPAFEERHGLYLDYEVRRLNAEYVSHLSRGK